jgi:peptidyl-prolyl cis-trans isomerase SurA
MKSRIILFVFIFTIILSSVITGETILSERIMAVVGDQVVLLSEIQMAILLETNGKPPSDTLIYNALLKKQLDNMIEDRLIFEAAKIESLLIDDESVDRAFNERFSEMKGQFPSEEQFILALKQEGYNLNEFKAQMREKIYQAMTRQRLFQKKFGNINLSDNELRTFYDQYKDSLPQRPGRVGLSAIVIRSVPNHDNDPSATLAAKVVRLMSKEVDYSDLADSLLQKNPDFVIFGGDGKFKKGELDPNAEETAFSLPNGKVSDPVRLPSGWIVIYKKGGDQNTANIGFISISKRRAGGIRGFYSPC